MKVLVVEDSERLLRSLGRGLKKSGFTVDLVGDGKEGWDYARLNDYDVIVLDILLPHMDGLTILRNLRAMGKQTHVLMLSAKDQVEDRVRGLQLGADDYMIKPFSFDELVARLNTLVRRRYETKNPVITIGHLTVNTATREVRSHGDVVNVTPGEYGILEHLVLNRGNVLSKEQLLDGLHDSDSYAGTNVIEVMVCNLRKKIDANGDDPIVQTRRGFGYFIA
ncbi:MAG: response regulator transcription factor [Verrucomicrobia bacterium]|nr:response regulator transcription factor [Verrucomicrobiota bacterium]